MYGVGTTALAPSEWEFTEAGRYRERGTDGLWHERNGSEALTDCGADQMYTNFTPPGLPLPAGTQLDAKKRYTYDGGSGARTLACETTLWRVSTGATLSIGVFFVAKDEIVREILEPAKVVLVSPQNVMPEELLAEINRLQGAVADARQNLVVAQSDTSSLLRQNASLRSKLDKIRDALDG